MVYYKLNIKVETSEQIDLLTYLLSIKSCNNRNWQYVCISNDNDPYIDYIDIFATLIESKIVQLNDIGINSSDISIWVEYEYDQQCNMEYLPATLLKLGQLGIKLCISCWQQGGFISFDNQDYTPSD